MPGFAGLFSLTDRPLDRPWLAAAVPLLRLDRDEAAAWWEHPGVRLAQVACGPSPEPVDAAQDEAGAVFVIGTVYGDAGARHAQDILQAYRCGGMGALASANGAFIIGIWDARERAAYLMADRLSLRKLYYAAVPDGLVFASSVKVLLAQPQVSRAVDPAGLAHLLALGYALDDHTLYASIRLLSGGTVLRWTPDARDVQVTSYWTPRVHARGQAPSLDACIDEMSARIEAAVARWVDGSRRIVLPLSAGFDSRALLGFLHARRPQVPVEALTVGHDHTHDVVFARRLARLCRIPHRTLPLPPDFMAKDSAAFVGITDGMVSAHNGWGWRLVGAARGAGQIVSGFLGDALSGSRFKDRMYEFADVEQLIAATYALHNVVFTELELHRMLRPRLAHQLAGVAVQDFGNLMRQADTDEPVDRVFIALLLARQRRYLSYMVTMLGAAAPVAVPFADTGVIDFFLGLPHAMRRKQFAYREMIARRFPRLARVPTGDNQPLAQPSWLGRRLAWRWQGWRERAAQALGAAPHDYSAYAHYGEWMRRGPMQRYLEETFARTEPYLADWCNPDEVRRLLDWHQAGPGDGYRKISALLTLALRLEQADAIPTVGAATAAPAAVNRSDGHGR